VRITSKGQVTIPAELRERLGLRPGSVVEFTIDGDAVRITKVEEAPGRGAGIVARLRGPAASGMTTDEIMALTRE
jgi:AbrB family looped-hinge helix DNA binding protein